MWTIIFFTSWWCSSFVMGNDDWLSHLSDGSQLKCEKSPPKSSKNEKLIFILHSSFDDQPNDPSNKSWLKCKNRPPKSSKNEMLSFGLCSTSNDRPSDLSDKHWPKYKKKKKGPSCHQKVKCSFLDNIQLLMISWAIWETNINQNVRKNKKGPLNHQKIEFFGLHSTSNDWPSNLSDKCWLKCQKMIKGPQCHRKIKCSFMNYVQLLMIGWAIWAMNINWNAKKTKKKMRKGPLCHQKIKCSFLDYV